MSIEEILEMMDDMIEKAAKMPFSKNRSLVDTDKFAELIEEIRMNLPTEIKQARNLVNDRKIILKDAKDEADSIIRKAEERAKVLVSGEEITKQAQARASEIMTNAQNKSKELRLATNEYVDNMLGRVEELLAKDLVDVKKTRSALKTAGK